MASALFVLHSLLNSVAAVTFSRAPKQFSSTQTLPGKCDVPLTYKEGRDCTLFKPKEFGQPYRNWDYLTGLCKTDYSRFQNGADQCLWQKCLFENNAKQGAEEYMKNIMADNGADGEAMYCWRTSMCTDPLLKVTSTIEDGEAACNARFGDAWKNLTVLETMTNIRGLGITACARGNYHCDASYCKLFFCGDFWKAKFGFMDGQGM